MLPKSTFSSNLPLETVFSFPCTIWLLASRRIFRDNDDMQSLSDISDFGGRGRRAECTHNKWIQKTMYILFQAKLKLLGFYEKF